MRDLMLAMELLRNFASRSGINTHSDLKLTLTFAERHDEWMFWAMVRREFSMADLNGPGRVTIAGISISFDNDQDIDKRKRLSEITRAPTE